MASLLKNLKTIAPCLLAITVDSLGFGLVYPILTMMFAGTHRTFLGPGVSTAEADLLFGLGYMVYPAGKFFCASLLGDRPSITAGVALHSARARSGRAVPRHRRLWAYTARCSQRAPATQGRSVS
jgi:hypothetical protein